MSDQNKQQNQSGGFNPIGLCMGAGVGLCFGVAMDNMALGLCLGMGIGLCWCVALGHQANPRDQQDGKPGEDQK